jgi:hypothetical protein
MKTSSGVPLKLGPSVGVVILPMQEWEDAKKKQDKALDRIEKGIGTLKGIGEAMGETLNQQDVVLDTIDDKVRTLHSQEFLSHFLVQDMISCQAS